MRLVRRGCHACNAANSYVPALSIAKSFLDPLNSYPAPRFFTAVAPRRADPSTAPEPRERPLLRHNPSREIIDANRRQQDDIIPHDLSATLDAHRQSNRDSIIRRVESKNTTHDTQKRDTVYKRLNLNNATEPAPATAPAADADQPHVFLGNEGNRANLRRKEKRLIVKAEKTGEPWRNNARPQPPLEYEGQIIPPITPLVVPEEELPWVDTAHSDPYIRLSAEIQNFFNYMLPSSAEREARDAVISTVQTLVRHECPGAEIEVFGSERTGLAHVTSDIDLRLFIENPKSGQALAHPAAPPRKMRYRVRRDLASLLPAFQRSREFKLSFLRHSRYPLISAQHSSTGIDIQVVCANDTQAAREAMQRYLDMYPGLREVYTVFKMTLDSRGLMDVYRGGIGSYGVFYMTLAARRMMPDIPSEDLGRQLLGCLSFWSKFDTYKNGLAVEPPEVFPKGSRNVITALAAQKLLSTRSEKDRDQMSIADVAQPYLLCLQDPAESANDLGRKTFGIKHIQKTIEALNTELSDRMDKDHNGSFLAPLVGSVYGVAEHRRKLMQNFAP